MDNGSQRRHFTHLKLEKQLYIQHKVNEEQTKLKLHQQKEIEEAIFLQNQREEELYRKKLEFEKEITESQLQRMEEAKAGKNTTAPQSGKLQKYTTVHNNAVFRRLQRLVTILKSIYGRSGWCRDFRNK